MRTKLLIGIAVFLIVACSGGESAHSDPLVIEPDPISEVYDSTQDSDVMGKDENQNGIRDDIDDAIKDGYWNPVEAKELAQKAIHSYTRLLTQPLTNEEQIEMMRLTTFASMCIAAQYADNIHNYISLENRLLNTHVRKKADSDIYNMPHLLEYNWPKFDTSLCDEILHSD